MLDASDDPAASSAAAWPAASLAEIEAILCAPGQKYEMVEVEVGGTVVRTWKNQPPNLAMLARFARASFGERTFLVHEDERVSYEGWFRATAALAADLRRRGVGRGDRVAVAMRNLPEWPVAFFAATAIGAIVVPLNAWWTADELRYGLADSGACAVICDGERWARIRPSLADLPALAHMLVSRLPTPPDAPAEPLEAVIGRPADYGALPAADLPAIDIAPDDEATIFYTSGTTGSPKGALGTHRNILTCVLAAGYVSERGAMRRGEVPPPTSPKVMLLIIPLFHVTACNAALMGAIASGSTLVFLRKWEPIAAFALIERERVSATGGVPTIAWQLLEHPDRAAHDLSSLETVSYGGAPVAPELARRLHQDLGVLPGNGWGMTETSATVTSHVGEDYLHRPESCGPALPVSDLKVTAEGSTEPLAVGEIGELWARGPQIVKGYWGNPAATAETFVGGWCRTGDLARLDAEGFCFIVDRAKDVIIRGGENIYSSEVENVLYEVPGVMDAALVGVSHRTLGEEPVAIVHLAPGAAASEEGVRAFVGRRLAAFKVPTRVLFVPDTLPRNANGKILKKELREAVEAGALG